MNVEAVREHLKWRGFGIANDDSLLTLIELNEVVRKGASNPLFKSDVAAMQSILIGKGIRISDDDPIFTLLAINDCVLRDAIRSIQIAQRKVELKALRAKLAWVALPAVSTFCAGLLLSLRAITATSVLVATIAIVMGALIGALVMLYLLVSGRINLTDEKET